MKKKWVLVIPIVLSLLFLSGCFRFDASIKIKKDRTVDISILYALSDSVRAFGDQSTALSGEEIAELEENGFTYQHYVDNAAGYSGYYLIRSNIPIDSIAGNTSDAGIESIANNSYLQINDNHVMFSFVPLSTDVYTEYGTSLSLLKSYGGYATITLELPVKPISHNAMSVSKDGKTLTWDLTLLGRGEMIYADFKMPPFIPIGPILLAAVIIAIIVIMVTAPRKRKKKYYYTDFED